MDSANGQGGALSTGTSERLLELRRSELPAVNNEIRIIAGVFLLFSVITMGGLIDSEAVRAVGIIYGCLALVAVVGVTSLALRLTPLWIVPVVSGSTAIVCIWLSVPPVTDNVFALSSQWLLHGAAMTGLLLQGRRSWIAVVALVVVGGLSMLAVSGSPVGTVLLVAVFVISVDALATGMADFSASRAWRSAAHRRDDVVTAAVAVATEAMKGQVRNEARLRLQLVTHKTVLNTFTALKHLPASIPDEQIREVARQNRAEITAFELQEPSPSTDVWETGPVPVVTSDRSDSLTHNEIMNQSIAVMTRRVVLWLAAGFIIDLAASAPGVELITVAEIPIILSIALLAWMISAKNPYPLRRVTSVLAAPLVALTVLSPLTASGDICSAIGVTFVSASTGFLLTVTVILLTGSRVTGTVVVATFTICEAIIVWLSITSAGDCGAAALADTVTSLATVVVLIFLRRNTTSLAHDVTVSQQETETFLTTEAASAQLADEMAGWAQTTLANSKRLLDELVDGAITPRDPAAMQEISAETRYLQNIVSCDRQNAAINRILYRVAGMARDLRANVAVSGSYSSTRNGTLPRSEDVYLVIGAALPFMQNRPLSRFTLDPDEVQFHLFIPYTDLALTEAITGAAAAVSSTVVTQLDEDYTFVTIENPVDAADNAHRLAGSAIPTS